MRRREFITALGGAAAAWPLAARAQQPGKVHRLGVLADVTPALGGLFYGLRDLGYVEGQNLIIERRSSEGRAERWSELAAELVGLRVDAIVVSTTPAALAAKKATGTIPIIFTTAFDLVGVGLAESLPRPGGTTPRTPLCGRKWRPPPGLPAWRLTLDKSESRKTSSPPSRQSRGSDPKGSLLSPTPFSELID